MPLVHFRPIRTADRAYCWNIYRQAMEPLAFALGLWNEAAQKSFIEQALADPDASILVENKSDAGWLSISESRHDIHIDHLYIEADRRGQGLGTHFLEWMSERARRKHKTLTLDVMANNNRARKLYERMGFANQGVDGHRIRMRLTS